MMTFNEELEQRACTTILCSARRKKFFKNIKTEYLSSFFLFLALFLVLVQLAIIGERVDTKNSPTILNVKTDKQVYTKSESIYITLDIVKGNSQKVPVDVKCNILDTNNKRITSATMLYSFTFGGNKDKISLELPSVNIAPGKYIIHGWLYEYTRQRTVPVPFASNEFEVRTP